MNDAVQATPCSLQHCHAFIENGPAKLKKLRLRSRQPGGFVWQTKPHAGAKRSRGARHHVQKISKKFVMNFFLSFSI